MARTKLRDKAWALEKMRDPRMRKRGWRLTEGRIRDRNGYCPICALAKVLRRKKGGPKEDFETAAQELNLDYSDANDLANDADWTLDSKVLKEALGIA